jgi:hypothetical protein
MISLEYAEVRAYDNEKCETFPTRARCSGAAGNSVPFHRLFHRQAPLAVLEAGRATCGIMLPFAIGVVITSLIAAQSQSMALSPH